MIAVDTSAIIAVLVSEPEEQVFLRLMTSQDAMVIGAPTLFEARLVLEGKTPGRASSLIRGLVTDLAMTVVAFEPAMSAIASEAFIRVGKGQHPAKLNFGDCLSYAVAKTHAVPLLFKGDDFVHTDLVPAYAP